MIWIVMPILIVLMFLLGTDLNGKSFTDVVRNPRAVIIGMTGQLILLPLIAFALAYFLKLPPVYFLGIMLIACCPGGSSSNVFSMLVKGDVALSVTLTAISSIVTMFTIPVIMEFTANFVTEQSGIEIHLPFGKLLIQNIVLLFVPLILGIMFRHYFPEAADSTNKVLSKLAFPALMLLAFIFFLQNTQAIIDNITILGMTISFLILAAMLCSSLLSRMTKSGIAVRRTIIIEVGMQNAAQAIAIATSPFIFKSDEMAIPAIIYALLMNVILLIYVAIIRHSEKIKVEKL